MNSDETYQLDVWKGDWGLPSIDIHSLQILVLTFIYYKLIIIHFHI